MGEQGQIEQLEAENTELAREVRRMHRRERVLRGGNWAMRKGYGVQGLLLSILLLGPGLTKSFLGWFRKAGPANPVPPEESANVMAAVVRRIWALGVFGLAVTLLPSFLMYRQNEYFRDQNDVIRDQMGQSQRQVVEQIKTTNLVRQQVETQAQNAEISRRTQLLQLIYERDDCEKTEKQTHCPPKAALRLRREAVLEFIQSEERRQAALDLQGAQMGAVDLNYANLWGANLRDTDLSGAVLAEVELTEADLSAANLIDANLPSASLVRATLSGANLSAANLIDANLTRAILTDAQLTDAQLVRAELTEADLTGAKLRDADLTGAKLRDADLLDTDLTGASLIGANLSDAKSLKQRQIERTCGDSDTQLPDDLERPAHWWTEPWDGKADCAIPKN